MVDVLAFYDSNEESQASNRLQQSTDTQGRTHGGRKVKERQQLPLLHLDVVWCLSVVVYHHTLVSSPQHAQAPRVVVGRDKKARRALGEDVVEDVVSNVFQCNRGMALTHIFTRTYEKGDRSNDSGRFGLKP